MDDTFALRGHLCYTPSPSQCVTLPRGYVLCNGGISLGVFQELPPAYAHIPVVDYGDQLLIPGLTDLHLHAPQYAFRGTHMDLELIQWLEKNTYPEESRYADISYAQHAYQTFVNDLRAGATTSACVYATVHVPATEVLMAQLAEAGLRAMVGKVNMDRNAPSSLCERDAQQSLDETEQWILAVQHRYPHVTPILTPRFVPSCSDALLRGLGKLRQKYGLPVQSHLSENPKEIAWVDALCPNAPFYGAAYDQCGLLQGNPPAVMAHCVYSSDEEIQLLKERGTFIAHCPQSNTNISSGIAPIRRYLMEGLSVGLGSDVAGGHDTSIFRAMVDAVQVSKLRWRHVDARLSPLTWTEAFYLGTKGGGAFFGKVGSLERGYALDCLVLNDTSLCQTDSFSLEERLERLLYLGDTRNIRAKYVQGRRLWTGAASDVLHSETPYLAQYLPCGAELHAFIDRTMQFLKAQDASKGLRDALATALQTLLSSPHTEGLPVRLHALPGGHWALTFSPVSATLALQAEQALLAHQIDAVVSSNDQLACVFLEGSLPK